MSVMMLSVAFSIIMQINNMLCGVMHGGVTLNVVAPSKVHQHMSSESKHIHCKNAQQNDIAK
jgi:hypothetical protein